MTTPLTERSEIKLSESKFPHCLRCNARVNALTALPVPNHPDKVIIEYQCHGESVSQELPASVLANEQGLSAYTAFNAYTSGLMLSERAEKQSGERKGGEK